jgi:hypothetical protein
MIASSFLLCAHFNAQTSNESVEDLVTKRITTIFDHGLTFKLMTPMG